MTEGTQPIKDGEIFRWKLIDRISHLFLVIAFIFGFLTGLPLFDGEMFGWMIDLVGGPIMRSLIHRFIVAPLLIIVVILQVIKFLDQKRTDAFPRLSEVPILIKMMKNALGLGKEKIELDFHHPGEKYVFLSAFVAVPTLGITGLIMWFGVGGQDWYLWARILHALAFMLMMVVLAGHFFMAISPSNWPVLKAMFTDGYVSLKWAMHHSGAWAKRVLAKVKGGSAS